MSVINWVISCYRRLKTSTHKRYIALFVFLVTVVPVSSILTLERLFGFQTPRGVWYLAALIYFGMGLGWLHLLREIPHSNDPARSRR